ncbi:Vault protein inter-alpha-trypsin domain protein [Catenulispora acidiphila DSM 44928]|uniref:Vault protein inter-alpha-trypsin domain protein n=1 Tax=Catenulispora acidiphila (strain DSM 44928 / JCM 14897 / NBRC 102108 / NRRL B-24433 / ID139908) TaxID=479433 RepID=C7PW75_CATAD|nr:VIT domain-containing protein [Catenulispora acidiphila]ACU73323.1 Vault protein inter-alpha-trypsin domain protein [Catenulispora acidiphila DSM 44928]
MTVVQTGVVDVVEEAPRPEPDGGLGALRTERGNLPLELIEVRSAVAGLAVRTELAQGFRNPYDVPLEATYIFPLPDRAAVTRLRMEAADRVIEGVIKEREAARADYDAAISAGQRASIAEEERPGVFTLRVGNIMPGERVVIRTSLSGRLPYEDGQATFRFPLVVAPRYIPGADLPGEQVGSGTASDTDQVPDASRISPPILLPGFPNPVRLSIEVAVDPVGLPLAGLTSSLHGVSVEESEGSRYLVRLNPGARADRDFVLRLGYGGSGAATSLAVAWDSESANEVAKESAKATPTDIGTFLLTVLPPEPTGATRPRDVALILDRSGSMGGWKMTAARRAAARIVDTLTAEDRFAVLTFDDQMETPDGLPTGLSEATDRHRFRAVQHLATVDARGGTEMEPPLRRAATLLSDDNPDRDRVLILITDGQVGNEDRLLTTLSPKLTHIRVHTVGIDTAVNAAFLQRLSTLGGGHCELVESEDRLDDAMDAIHHRIATPLVTGLHLTGVGGLELEQNSVTPTRLPDLFAGAPLVVAGRLGGKMVALGATASDKNAAAGESAATSASAVALSDSAATSKSTAAIEGSAATSKSTAAIEGSAAAGENAAAVGDSVEAGKSAAVLGDSAEAGGRASALGNSAASDTNAAAVEGAAAGEAAAVLGGSAEAGKSADAVDSSATAGENAAVLGDSATAGETVAAVGGAAAGSGEDAAAADTIPGIVITGTAADGSAWSRRVAGVGTADAGLGQFWARGRIRDLEDRYVSTYGGQAEIERAIVAASVEHSVLSRFTAFVVVDSRVVNAGGAHKQVTQPVDLPDGWAADFGGALPVSASMPAPAADAHYSSLDFGARVSRKSVRARSVGAPKPGPLAPGGGPGYGGAMPAPGAPMPSVPPSVQPLARPLLPPLAEPAISVDSADDMAALPDFLKESTSAADELRALAATWLPRLTAAANDTAEAQEKLLTEFATELRELAPRLSSTRSADAGDLLSTLTALDKPFDKPLDKRRQSAIAFLESVQQAVSDSEPTTKPRRAPFWKR